MAGAESQYLPLDAPFDPSLFGVYPDTDGNTADTDPLFNSYGFLPEDLTSIADLQPDSVVAPGPGQGVSNNVSVSPAVLTTNADTPSGPACQCIASLYSTLASFQQLPPSSFPYSMGALTRATTVAREALRCKHCPAIYATALQNLLSLCTLLPLIVMEYEKLLRHIDERYARGGTISFRVGENSLDQLHLHTSTLDCPMAFDVDFSVAEWRTMARKVVKQKVLEGTEFENSLLGIVEELESRQRNWHAKPLLAEFRHGLSCMKDDCSVDERHTCLQMVSRIKVAIEKLELND